jgi:hypothetical protein
MCVLPTENIHINWADSIQFFLHPITNVEIVVANNFGSKNEFIEEIFFVVFREEPKLLAVKNCFERGGHVQFMLSDSNQLKRAREVRASVAAASPFRPAKSDVIRHTHKS